MNFMLLKYAPQIINVSEVNSHDLGVSAMFATQNDEFIGRRLFEGLSNGPADAPRAASNCNFDHAQRNRVFVVSKQSCDCGWFGSIRAKIIT